jgi:hypothetical protein
VKALSLQQPWASLWLHGPKLHETRAFRTAHRGWLLVHASKAEERPPATVAALCARKFGPEWFSTLPRGVLLGAVYLHDCEPTGIARKHAELDDLLCGDFTPGRWAWRRVGPTVRFNPVIPYRGMPWLFEVEHSLLPQAPFGVAMVGTRK